MALTRITKGVIKPNENYDTHNINSTGIVTATALNISGNASIGGVLTYEDVTNIDSVGIITARDGIDCNGDVSIAGVTTITAGAFSANLSVGGRTIAPNIDIPSTSLRTGIVVRNANDYRTDSGDNGGFQVLDPYNHAATSFAFRAAEGTTLVDNAWIKTNGTAYFADKVGIGSNSPAQKLEVDGKIKVFGSGGTGYSLTIDPDSTGGTQETLITKANADLRLQAGAASYSANLANILLKNSGSHIIMNAGNNGNVGVGTVNALARLDVYKGTSATDVDIFSVRSKTGAFNIQCSDTDAANPEWRLRTYSNEDIVFSPGGTGSSAEKLRITSGGQLNLAGNMQFTAANPELEFNNGGPRFAVPAANTLTIHNGGTLGSTNNEVLRITSGGHLTLQGGIIYGEDNASNVLKIQSTSGNNNHSRIEIGASQSSDNGGIHFYTAGTSVATRHMTLKGTSGNLGIGVDNPTAKLEVNGSSSFGPGVLEESYMNDTGGGIQSNYNHDVLSYGMVWYGVTNAVAGWTFNIRGNASTTFNSITNTNKVTTMTIYSANNNAANYMSAFNIDGVTQTIKWAGGSAPSVATGSGVDVYSITIMKTGGSTYHVFGNFTNFA